MSTEISQSVTSKRSDIPTGYIAISSFGCHKGNTDRKASEEYKALYQAWCDERISGIKLMKSVHDKRGQIFVDPLAAERVITECRKPPAKQKAVAACVVDAVDRRPAEGVCQTLSSMDTTLDEIYRVLERLTAAVEGIATQPKEEAAGAWRDMNGESL